MNRISEIKEWTRRFWRNIFRSHKKKDSLVDLAVLYLADFRWVKIWVGDKKVEDILNKSCPTYNMIVHKDDIRALYDSFFRLHHDPGVNPHSGNKCAPFQRFVVSRIARGGPYWWTTPNLDYEPIQDSRPGVSYLESSSKEEVLF